MLIGGYLQWDELDCVNMKVKKVDPDIQAPALDQIREMCYANGRYNWSRCSPNFAFLFRLFQGFEILFRPILLSTLLSVLAL